MLAPQVEAVERPCRPVLGPRLQLVHPTEHIPARAHGARVRALGTNALHGQGRASRCVGWRDGRHVGCMSKKLAAGVEAGELGQAGLQLGKGLPDRGMPLIGRR